MFKKVAFTYYPVTDVARARKFYEETLGLKSGSAGNQGDNWWVEYDLPGGGCLVLTNFTKEKPSDKRSIDDDLVLCIDRHRNEGERCIVTVYLISGERVTGIFQAAIPDDDSPPLAA